MILDWTLICFVHVCMFVCIYICSADACTHAHTKKFEDNIEGSALSLSILFSWHRSLTESETRLQSMNYNDLPVKAPQWYWYYRHMCNLPVFVLCLLACMLVFNVFWSCRINVSSLWPCLASAFIQSSFPPEICDLMGNWLIDTWCRQSFTIVSQHFSCCIRKIKERCTLIFHFRK